MGHVAPGAGKRSSWASLIGVPGEGEGLQHQEARAKAGA